MTKPRPQNRRAVSVSGETYDKLKEFCKKHGCSMSGVAETILRKDLGMDENEKIDSYIRETVTRVLNAPEMPDPLFPEAA